MPRALTRFAASPWAVGLLLGLLHFARRVVDALSFPIQRFDEGIQLSSGWFMSHGEVPLRDFYQPYGPGFGVPGVIGRWLFGNGLFADRLVYFLAPPALTTVAYVFMARRRGWRWGLALALLTLPSSVPRYAMCSLAILAAGPIALGLLGGCDLAASRVLFSYVAGAALALLWAVQLLARARRRPGPIVPDPTLVAPFLAALAAFAVYAQSVRFSPENGVAVLPGIAAAWFALRLRVRVPARRLVLAGAALALVAFLPMLKTYATLPADAVAVKDKNEAPEPTPRLDHIPVRTAEWPSMAGIHALWRERGLAGRPVLATNRRNDVTYANGAYLPWFLDAPPGAWITTYDPGLADRDSVQRDAAAELCRNRAPVVEEDQDPSATSNGEFGFEDDRIRP